MGQLLSSLGSADEATRLRVCQRCGQIVSAHRVCVLANGEEAARYCGRLREQAEECAAAAVPACAKSAGMFNACIQKAMTKDPTRTTQIVECSQYLRNVRACLKRNGLQVEALHKVC